MTENKKNKLSDIHISNRLSEENQWIYIDDIEKKVSKPTLLLHSCCGPCSTSVVERLVEDYEITIFFYNPNITDEDEYIRRKESQKLFIEKYNENPVNPYTIGFKEGVYDRRNFYEACRGLEDAPEGGKRCQECFLLRLSKTAEMASLMGYDSFGTTLTVSPHKDYSAIKNIGRRMASRYTIDFLDMDFKKKDGYRRSVELSKQYELYRQNYCGCEFANHNLRKQEGK